MTEKINATAAALQNRSSIASSMDGFNVDIEDAIMNSSQAALLTDIVRQFCTTVSQPNAYSSPGREKSLGSGDTNCWTADPRSAA